MERIRTLSALLEAQLGVNTHPEVNPLPNLAGVTATRILPNNDNRVALTMINNGAFPVWIWTDNTVGANNGILLAANGGANSLNWRDDMSLVANEWWAIAIGGASQMSVLGVVTL